ncbi:MAG: ATP-binding protein [Flavihumibacter sp.]|nr:ATP-binding protein [Flavihumibacter sp.]
MTPENKKEIAWKLSNYVFGFPSQRQALATINGCSEATGINMIKGNWDNISDEMWRIVEYHLSNQQIGKVVETTNFQTLILYYTLAKENGATFALTGGAGYGKSFAGKFFRNVMRGKNVYYLECAEYWNKKAFLCNLLMQMGRPYAGMNVSELMHTIVSELRRQHQPLIILDEVDKLSDPVLKFFITLYNELNGKCGFVWTSTNNIEKRINKGVSNNRNGYQELLSRIGQKFIVLHKANIKDVEELCHANGIKDTETVHAIFNDCDGDLRRVERHFLKAKAKERRKTLKVA